MDFKILVFVILVVATINAEYQSYKNYKVYKIVPKDEREVKILEALQEHGDYTFWSDNVKEMSDVRIMVAPRTQQMFEGYMTSVNIPFKAVIEDVQELIDAQLKRPDVSRSNLDYSWDYYQNIEEIHEWLQQTADAHSDVASIINIGTTYGERSILGIKIDYRKQERPTIGMIEGGIHAREWISPATLTWIINEFLTSDDPNIRFLAENIVWHIIPVANPDGYAYTFTNNRMWRKNRNPSNFVSCAQWNINDDMSNGIDLNRNFGFVWMTTGASSNPCSDVYAGPVANSELEAISIINYVRALQAEGDLVYYFAFHSYTQLVLVPFSHVGGSDVLQAENYGDMYEIAIKGMDKIKERYGTQYTVGTSMDILYEVSGSSFDWAKGVANIPIVYLFELRDVGEYGFLLPTEQIIPNNQEIMDGLLEVDRVARQLGYWRNGVEKLAFNIVLTLLALFIVL